MDFGWWRPWLVAVSVLAAAVVIAPGPVVAAPARSERDDPSTYVPDTWRSIGPEFPIVLDAAGLGRHGSTALFAAREDARSAYLRLAGNAAQNGYELPAPDEACEGASGETRCGGVGGDKGLQLEFHTQDCTNCAVTSALAVVTILKDAEDIDTGDIDWRASRRALPSAPILAGRAIAPQRGEELDSSGFRLLRSSSLVAAGSPISCSERSFVAVLASESGPRRTFDRYRRQLRHIPSERPIHSRTQRVDESTVRMAVVDSAVVTVVAHDGASPAWVLMSECV